MTKLRHSTELTWSRLLLVGAGAGVGLTFLYASAFAFYTICRSSLAIVVMIPADISLLGTLIANATTVVLAATSTSLLLALPTALLGMVTAALIEWLLVLWNQQKSVDRALLLGSVAALAVIALLHMTVWRLMGQPLSNLGVQTYLFWLGLPGLIHLGAGVVGAWYLNRRFRAIPTRKSEARYVKKEGFTGAG